MTTSVALFPIITLRSLPVSVHLVANTRAWMCHWMCDWTCVLGYILSKWWCSLGVLSRAGLWKCQWMWAISGVKESGKASGRDSVLDLANLTWVTWWTVSVGFFSIWSSIVEMAGFAWAIWYKRYKRVAVSLPKFDVNLPPWAGGEVG